MTRCLLALMLLIAVSSPLPASAQAERIDDSRSQVLGGMVRMDWEQTLPSTSGPNMIQGRITVLVRLDTAPWVGRSGRVFHVLAKQPTPVQARWTSRGILLPGEVRDGERTLVHAGPITSALLEDTLDLVIRANGDLLDKPERLEFYFEFEPEGG